MRNAKTILNIIRERGAKGLPWGRYTDNCITRSFTCTPMQRLVETKAP